MERSVALSLGTPAPGTRRARRGAALVAVALTLALTACGSRLDPETVRAAEGVGTAPVGTTPVAADTPTTPGAPVATAPGTDPTSGATTAPDPGAPTGPDTAPDGDDDPSPAPGGDPDGEGEPPVPAGEQGSCDGFQNGPGITDDTVTIANASDISGPVPGLFQSAQDAVKAFTAYFNATSDLCGRKLALLSLDTRADAGGDQQAYATACEKAFAAIGSMSSQDQGGAATANGCGLPDIRSITTTPQRRTCGSCFSAYSVAPSLIPGAHAGYWLKAQPEASRHVGVFYVNVEAARVNAQSFAAGIEKTGMNVDLVQGIDTAEFNYTPYVQQMKDKGIRFVAYYGPFQFAIKLQQAMQQQSFTPDVYYQDPTIYDDTYVAQAGSAAEGSYVYTTHELFDDTSIPEMVLYRSYLAQVAPNSVPNYYGLFAWSAARLFVEQAAKLGGRLTRASLVAALKKVNDWTANGLHAPMKVGSKTTPDCLKVIQLTGGRWRQVSPGDYVCKPGIVETGVGR
ncbi:ABC transporter substrate-binding protein [Nocardioides sp.]|uniref:ABC transporter substrate-binding protein n=1 Tax=Nocardioides sp. TaxID=35761 RepID=UPI003515ACA7